jgi:ABC-type sugar transport system substrate-binding protein
MKRQKIKDVLKGLLTFVLAAMFVTACSDSGSSGGAAAPAAAESSQSAVSGADAGSLPKFDNFPRPKMSSDGKKLVVAYLYGTIDLEDDQRMYRQINIEGYKRGWEIRNIEVKTDEQLIRNGWLTAINMGVDAIVVPGMSNLENKQDLITQSRNAGIGIYGWDILPLPGVITNFTIAWGAASLDLFYKVASDLSFEGDFCITTAYLWASIWERSLPIRAYLENDAIFPNLRLLDEQSVDFASPIALPEQCYNFMQVWNQKYGKEIDAVYVVVDSDALVVNESAVAAGRTPQDLKIFTTGGNADVLAAMRNPACTVQYNFVMSYESWVHTTCELIDQIQIKGYTPGDGKCMIDKAGGNTWLDGQVVTKENLPVSGSPIFSLFDYYDENDKDAWYFWTTPDYPEVYKWQ